MTDSNAKPVSMRKKPAQSKTDVPRPQLVRVLAVLMALSGLFAVISALTFYGEHDFLVRNLAKSEPQQKITSSTVNKVSSQTSAGLRTALAPDTGSTLSAAAITAAADRTVDVFRSSLPSVNVTNDERNDQVKNVRSTVTSALKNVNGSLTAAQITAQTTAVQTQVKDDLTAMQKNQLTAKQIDDKASKIPTSTLILSLFLLVALGFVAKGVYDGRYWGRWAVPAVWVLASFTGTPAGFTALLLLGSDLPLPYKAFSALSAAALTAAFILSFLRPTRAWFQAHRPVVADGAPQRRGMFAPRVPPPAKPGRTTPGRTSGAPARTSLFGGAAARAREAATARAEAAAPAASAGQDGASGPDRARTKKRTAEPSRNGADTVRTPGAPNRRRPASKSRRTEG